MDKKKGFKLKGLTSSIKGQLAVTMIAVVAIPLLIVIIVSAAMTRSKSLQDIDDYNTAKAEAIESHIASVLDQNVKALQAFAAAPSTIMFVETANGTSDNPADLSADILKNMQTIDQSLNDGNITIISGAKGMQILRSDGGDLVDMSDKENYQKGMAGTIYVSNLQVAAGGDLICNFTVPIYDNSGSKVVGIAQRNYKLADFHDILASEVYEDRHEIVIVDRNGDVLAHSGHLVDPNNLESQAGNPFYTDSRGDVNEGAYKSVWQGDTWIISWVKEPNTGWVVASCRVQGVAMHSFS